MEGLAPLNPILVGLEVADDPTVWRAAGFHVDDDGTCRIGSVLISLVGRGPGRGIRSWTLAGASLRSTEVDGVVTAAATPPDAGTSGPAGAAHPNGALVIDHVVMTTPDPDRTITAIEAIGGVHRRTRLADGYDRPMRQDFFRFGEVILEQIGPRQPDPAHRRRPARLYGLAHTVADLDATAAVLGPLLTTPKDAVQPGRRIATLRTRDIAMSVPTAFMSRGAAAVA